MVSDEWPLLLEPGITHHPSKCIGEFPTDISVKFIGSVILEDDGIARMVRSRATYKQQLKIKYYFGSHTLKY